MREIARVKSGLDPNMTRPVKFVLFLNLEKLEKLNNQDEHFAPALENYIRLAGVA